MIESDRILEVYTRLLSGQTIDKAEAIQHYEINERTLRRDINKINSQLSRSGRAEVRYSRKTGLYRLEEIPTEGLLSNQEVLAMGKVLLESRAFSKGQAKRMIDILISQTAVDGMQAYVKSLLHRDLQAYKPLQFYKEKELELKLANYGKAEPSDPKTQEIQDKALFDHLWVLAKAVNENRYVRLTYRNRKGAKHIYTEALPLSIMFSDFYFYIHLHIEDDTGQSKLNLRIDRIQSIVPLDKQSRNRGQAFDEGYYRDRTVKMYTGPLREIVFDFKGDSVEFILDKFPTAKSQELGEGIWRIRLETFGQGIDGWLIGMGDAIRKIRDRYLTDDWLEDL